MNKLFIIGFIENIYWSLILYPIFAAGYAAPSHVVMQQPPVTVMIPPPQQPKPPNNLPLALIACLCCNGCCIGLVALVFALRSDSAFSEGRVSEMCVWVKVQL